MKKENKNIEFKASENKNQPFQVISFNSSYEPPKNSFNIGKGYATWGKDNLYPNYIIDMYNYKGSTTHKATINRKVDFISGRGFEDIQSESLRRLVKRTKLVQEIKQATLDYELLNGFALEVIWANDGETIASIKCIPFHKVRDGIPSDDIPFEHFLYSTDWKQYRKEDYAPNIIKMWDPSDKTGKQIYVYKEYNPGMDIYPIPNYSQAFNAIETEYQISVFHLNQVNQGYSPSFLLNFATGIPEPEEMKKFNKNFQEKYAGAENAGKIVLTYSKGIEQQPHLEAVKLNDSDKRFNMLNVQLKNDIIMASNVPPQLLITIPGQLGGDIERNSLLSDFQMSYVTPRQEKIEDVLNNILFEGGYTEKLELKEYQSIKQENKIDN